MVPANLFFKLVSSMSMMGWGIFTASNCGKKHKIAKIDGK
jgi:hypothetical protein